MPRKREHKAEIPWERGTFVSQVMPATNDPFSGDNQFSPEKMSEAVVEAKQGLLVPFTRIADLDEGLQLIDLDDLQGHDLIIHDFTEWSSENGLFMTLECSILNDPDHSEGRFLTNCGGQVAMKRIRAAFTKVKEGRATPPLVAQFAKIKTGSGRDFWNLT